jgi:hypothetical protein
MDGFIKKYQNMFMNSSAESTFHTTNNNSNYNLTNTTNHATAFRRDNPKQKRLKSNLKRDLRDKKKQHNQTHDVIQEGVWKRVKNHWCCSFCQNSNHIITLYTARSILKTWLLEEKSIQKLEKMIFY